MPKVHLGPGSSRCDSCLMMIWTSPSSYSLVCLKKTLWCAGEGVEGLSVGDLVIAVPPDGMGSYLLADARVVSKAPECMAPSEAVAGTCAYATAWLALHWMACIKQGERVLIHSAAGGVGLAALHLCKRKGCEVYATASTEEKRRLLRSLGAITFHSRRVADFEEGILEATNNEGVDVVLNSLSGRAIPASLNLPFGLRKPLKPLKRL